MYKIEYMYMYCMYYKYVLYVCIISMYCMHICMATAVYKMLGYKL